MAVLSSRLRTTVGAILFVASIAIFFWGQPGAFKRVGAFFVAVAAVALIYNFGARIWVLINRSRGIYPQKGNETMEDVKRLALSGHKFFAIDVYCKVNKSNANEATKEVDRIISAGKGNKD